MYLVSGQISFALGLNVFADEIIVEVFDPLGGVSTYGNSAVLSSASHSWAGVDGIPYQWELGFVVPDHSRYHFTRVHSDF